MKKVLALATVAAALTLVGTTSTAQADHNRSVGRSGVSFGFSTRSYRPSYYRPSYGYNRYSYSRPSSGFTYARPGFSISVGNGGYYRPSYGYSRFSSGSSRFGGGYSRFGCR